MFRKRKRHADSTNNGHANASQEMSLVLEAEGGATVYVFPSDIVQSHRHMITRLMRDSALPQAIAVVSALRGEGVSFTALAMAATIGRDFSKTVCAVDLNWWWPSERVSATTKSNPGIAGVLHGDITLDEVLVHTNYPNLALLPAGSLPPDERHVIARGAALRVLIEQLCERFDYLLLDIPAILATSDAIPLASLGDTCCVVVNQGSSSTTLVKQALDDIAHLSVLGVVVNRVKVATPSWIVNLIPQ